MTEVVYGAYEDDKYRVSRAEFSVNLSDKNRATIVMFRDEDTYRFYFDGLEPCNLNLHDLTELNRLLIHAKWFAEETEKK